MTKRVIICMHGNTYSNEFLIGWTMALNYIWKNTDWELLLSQGLSDNHFYSRLQSMNIDISKDNKDKPFKNIDYDIIVMIDPNILFKPEDLKNLIERCLYKNDVVSGLYLADPQYYFASIDKELMKIDIEEEKNRNEKNRKEDPLNVSFVGLGFFACKRKVIESLEFPYFTNCYNEEISFCNSIKDKGFNITLYKDIHVCKKMLLTL
jgi:hypothetical protein